jgi:hypothetical protein
VPVHPLTNHEIVRLRHEERVGRAHAAIHALEARDARSSKTEPGEQRSGSWLGRLRRRESATAQTPARSGTS